MQIKDELFTLINDNVAIVICLFDKSKESGAQVLEALNYLVDGTLEERILKSKNTDLNKEGSCHYFFTNQFGKKLNIVLRGQGLLWKKVFH